MKVRKLLKLLKNLPPNSVVRVEVNDNGHRIALCDTLFINAENGDAHLKLEENCETRGQ